MFHGFIFFIILSFFQVFAHAECPNKDLVKDQYIVKTKKNTLSLSKLSVDKDFSIISIIKSNSSKPKTLSKVSNSNASKILVIKSRNIKNLNSQFEYVQQDCFIEPFALSLDPLAINQDWYFSSLNADKDFDLRKRQDVTVAVIDTGVDLNHDDLSNNIWSNEAELNGEPGVDDDSNGFVDDIFGYDVADNDNDPIPTFRDLFLDFDHGTHVAGLIAADFDNGIGVAGISHNQVKVMAVKGFRSQERTPISDLLKGIYYAVDNGADIINASWGSTKSADQAEIDAVNYALRNKVLIVAAAGNTTEPASRVTPASIPGVVTIGSVNSDNELSTFSNYGASVNFVSPGGDGKDRLNENLLSTIIQNSYDGIRGTSMSAPLVSGILALLMSQKEELTPLMALRALNATATDHRLESYDSRSTQVYRKPNLEEALNYIDSNDVIAPLDPILLTVVDPSEDIGAIELSSNVASSGSSGCGLISSNAKTSGLEFKSIIVTLILIFPSFLVMILRRKDKSNFY